MKLKHGLLMVTVAALGAAAGWMGRGTSVEAASPMVYELRTYHCEPGKLPDLLARFRNHTTKLFEKHGMVNLGYWVPADGEAHENTLIYIVGHKSRDAAKASWAAFREDPAWVKARTESEVAGKIVAKVESVYMNPTDFSKLQ
jgi:hypothetical protein